MALATATATAVATSTAIAKARAVGCCHINSYSIAAARPLQRLTPLFADVLLSFVKLLKPKNTTISNAYYTLLSLCSFFWSSHIYLIIVLFNYLLNKSVLKTSGCFYFSITNIFECILKCILQYYAPVNRF